MMLPAHRPRRFSVRSVTGLLVFVVFVATAIIGTATFISARRHERASERASYAIRTSALYEDALSAAYNEWVTVIGFFSVGDPAYKQAFYDSRYQAEAALVALRDDARTNNPEEVSRLDRLIETHADFAETDEIVLDAIEQGNLAAALEAALETDLYAESNGFLRDLSLQIESQREVLSDAQDEQRAAEALTLRWALGIAAASAAFLLFVGFASVHWIGRPLARASRASRAIAAGDLAARVPETGPVELADLGADVNRMAESLIKRSDELNAYLSKDLESRTLELEQSNTALGESERRFRSLVQNASDMITVIDADGTLTYASPAFERLMGHPPEEWIGRNLLTLIHPEDLDAVRAGLAQLIEEPGSERRIETRVYHRDGAWRFIETTATNLLDEPMVAGIVNNSRDITERKRFEARLVELANHDSLTGLYNGRSLQEALEQELARAREGGRQGALLFLDLDQFKDVNDSLGHGTGDELLAAIAILLRERLRGSDIVGRLGGDEFAILLPDTACDAARAIGEGLVASIREHAFTAGDHTITATVSGGMASFPNDGTTVGELLSRADLAMYRAKEQGRNRFRVYSQDMGAQAESRLAWQQRIRDALENRRFVLLAQPIIDQRAGDVSQYELLLRMRGDGGELILPGEFLDVAERSGQIQDIDRWVVHEAIAMLAIHQRAGTRMVVEVNLSARAFGDPEMLPLIRRELKAAGVDPGSLILEVTETTAIGRIEQARRFVETLKELGCKFALDDFGVGFSSFNYLKQLPVDYLKIDGSFIKDLPASPVDQQLVQGMVAIAHALGKKTIAEFVEDAPTLALLRHYGVDYAQGLHIGAPGALPLPGIAARRAA